MSSSFESELNPEPKPTSTLISSSKKPQRKISPNQIPLLLNNKIELKKEKTNQQ